MSEEGVYIRDVRSLEKLNNMIVFTGEVMVNIEENVSKYLEGVQKVLDKQLEAIQERLKEAEERLGEAQAAMSACHASQVYDQETGEYYPSCSWEEHAVEVAQKEVDEWYKKYLEGKRIVEECQGEIADYNATPGLVMPPGGHYLIAEILERQTKWAAEQLQDYINDLDEYLNNDVGGDPNSITGTENPAVREEDRPMTDDERFAAFKENIQGVKDEQEEESYQHHIQDANRAMRCPCCGMPLQLCTCRNKHVDVDLYQ